MIWLILFLAIPGIVFAAWFTIIETAHDHLMSWPGTILAFVILLILIIVISILIWVLCTNIALETDVKIEPQELVETIKSDSEILVIYESSGKTYITYTEENRLFSTKINAHLSTVTVRESLNNQNYIEVYTAIWASSLRRFLYGKYVPEKYYIVYTTGD